MGFGRMGITRTIARLAVALTAARGKAHASSTWEGPGFRTGNGRMGVDATGL